MLADAYLGAGRPMDAVTELLKATALAPQATRRAGMRSARPTTPSNRMRWPRSAIPQDAPWRQLLSADALLANNHLTDAFAALPGGHRASAVDGQHSRFSRRAIYERTGHPAWAARERAKGRLTTDGLRRGARRCASSVRAGIVRLSPPRCREFRPGIAVLARARSQRARARRVQTARRLPDSPNGAGCGRRWLAPTNDTPTRSRSSKPR